MLMVRIVNNMMTKNRWQIREKIIFPCAIAVCFCSLFFYSISAFAHPSTDSQQANEQKTNHQLSQVKKAISQEKSTIKSVDNQRNRLLSQLKDNELAIANIIKDLSDTQQSLKSADAKIKRLNIQKTTLSHDKRIQENVLAQQLRAAYTTGHHDYVKLLLNQENPGSIQRTVTYYQYLNKARIEEIEQYKETIDQLTDVVIELQQQTEQLKTLKQTQSQQKLSLSKSQAKRQATVNQLNQQLIGAKQKLTRLEEEEQNLVAALARIAKLSKQEVDLNGLSKLKKQLSWPVRGKMLRSFGSKKRDYLKWKGVLISSPVGREVKTIHNGTVLFSDWLKGYGLVTVIDHGKGYMSLYGHNQALLKSVGDRVETGEPIALVGQSGGQNRSALYFEIRYNGQAVNPKRWCK